MPEFLPPALSSQFEASDPSPSELIQPPKINTSPSQLVNKPVQIAAPTPPPQPKQQIKRRYFGDSRAIKNLIYDNVLQSASTLKPAENTRYRLSLHDLEYADEDKYPLLKQKEAILGNKTLYRRLKGTWHLTDAKTGDVVEKKRMTVAQVPHMTERGTFVLNGTEYTLCLHEDTKVLTSEGYIGIKDIVSERKEVQVLSYSFVDNRLEWKKITNWYASPLLRKLRKYTCGTNTVWATPNHNAFNTSGFKDHISFCSEVAVLSPNPDSDNKLTWNIRDVIVESRTDKENEIEPEFHSLMGYDLEVEGNHNYFANDILVSNSHQMRLRPGVFTRVKANGEVEAHVNVMPGHGVSHRYFFEPETSVFRINVGQSKVPLLPILHAMGLPDSKIREAWGNEIFAINQAQDSPHIIDKLYQRMVRRADLSLPHENKAKALSDELQKMELDPEVTKRTLGKPYSKLTADAILDTTKKLLAVNRQESETDDRDHLAFQTLMGPEDLLAERIVKDRTTLTKLLWHATHKGNLNNIQPGVFTNAIMAAFKSSGLGQAAEEVNAAELVDHQGRITRLGEGGIADAQAVPDESRAVNPSQMAFIDPTKSPECLAHSDDKPQYFMTKEGWKACPDVTENDEFACLINGRLEFHKPTKLHVADYDGPIYSLESNNIAYRMTPNHRMWVKDYKSTTKWKFETADQVHDNTYLFQIGGHKPLEGNLFSLTLIPTYAGIEGIHVNTNNLAELVGWFLGKGCFLKTEDTQGIPDGVFIEQPQKTSVTKYNELGKLLDALPFEYKPTLTLDGYVVFDKRLVKYLVEMGKDISSRRIPEEWQNVHTSARKRLFDGLLRSRGKKNVPHKSYEAFRPQSVKLVDDFCRLAFGLGYSTRTLVRACDPKKQKDIYVHLQPTRLVKARFNEETPYTVEHYKGKVYCVTVPGGMIYTKLGDKGGLWSGNSFKAGVDLRTAFGVRKGSDGKLYAPFKDPRKPNRLVYKTPQELADMIIAFPGEIDSGKPYVHAMNKGKLTYVNRDEVDLELPSMENAFSPLSNMIPMKTSTKGQRVSMGARMISQALPLMHAESPNVQSAVPGIDNNGERISFEELYGRHMGPVLADKPGVVKAITPDGMTIKHDDGETRTYELYNHHPYNRKCVTGDSVITILREDRTVWRGLIASYTHEDGDKIQSISPKTNKATWCTVSAFTKIPLGDTKKLLTVTTSSGRSVTVTEDHSLVTNKDGKLVPLYPYQCEIGKTRVPVISMPKLPVRLPTVMGLDGDIRFYRPDSLGYLSGLFCCAGYAPYWPSVPSCFRERAAKYVGTKNDAERMGLIFLNISASTYVAGSKHFEALFDNERHALAAVAVDFGASQDPVRITNKPELYRWLRDNFGGVKEERYIRPWIMGSIHEFRTHITKALIEGLGKFDKGNFTLRLPTKRLRDDVVDLLSTFGIFSTIDNDPGNWREDFENAYSLFVKNVNKRKMFEWINTKQDKPAPIFQDDCISGYTIDDPTWSDRSVVWDTIVSIKQAPYQTYVYDLTVEDSHVFAVNCGLVVHNTYLHNIPLKKVGDRVDVDDILARSNYTNDTGTAALGINARVAYLPFRGKNYEDAAVISESMAKRLTSEHMYQHVADFENVHKGKNAFVSLFPGVYNKTTLDSMDDQGVIKPGTVVKYGDPLVLMAVEKERAHNQVHRGKTPFSNNTITWKHHSDGLVTDVMHTRNGALVAVKAYMPMQQGDKLCYDEATEVLTKEGWKSIKDIVVGDVAASLNPEYTLETEFVEVAKVFSSDHTNGLVFKLETDGVDLCITPNHKMFVRLVDETDYKLIEARYLADKQFYVLDKNKQESLVDGTLGKWEVHTGYVYCPMLECNHVLCVRRNDKTVWCGNSGRYGDKCYCPETSVLTRTGWKKAPDVTINDEIATLNPTTDELEYQKPLQVHEYDYDDYMYRLETSQLSMRVTLNHKLWVAKHSKKSSTYEGVRAGDLYSNKATRWKFKKNCTWSGSEQDKFYFESFKTRMKSQKFLTEVNMDDWLEFLGYYLADGTCGIKGRHTVIFTKSPKSPTWHRLKNCLERLGLTFTYRKITDNVGTFMVTKYGYWLHTVLSQLGDSLTKRVPRYVTELSPRQIGIFLDAYTSGNQNKSEFETTSYGLAEDLQELFLKNGSSVNLKKVNKNLWKGKVVTKNLEPVLTKDSISRYTKCHETLERYEGKVYCVSVPNQVVMIKHNDKPHWTHNSVVSEIVPDDQMPHDSENRPFEILVSPAGMISRINAAQAVESALGKISSKTGKPYKVDDFTHDNMVQYALDELDKHKMSDTEEVTDPLTNRKIPGVLTGNRFFMKLHHTSECFDAETEVLTATGWKHWPDVTLEDKLATLVDDNFVYEHPLELIKQDYSGPMFCYSDNIVNYCVTPNHKIYARPKNESSYEFIRADLLHNSAFSIQRLAFDTDKAEPFKYAHLCGVSGVHSKFSVVTYNGYVYCATMQSGLLYVRRNRKEMLSGNSKGQGRGAGGGYSAEGVPSKGGETGSKRMSLMDSSALLAHGATDVLRDAHVIRGQKNEDYWLRFMMGQTPPEPKVPFIYDKFINELKGAGINVIREGRKTHVMALTDKDIQALTEGRSIENAETVDWKEGLKPIKGGLFDPGLTGGHSGNRWSRIELHEPLPNPAMEEPIRRVLGLTEANLLDIIAGKKEIHGKTGPNALKDALAALNIPKEIARAKAEIASGRKSYRDSAIRRLQFLTAAEKLDIHPKDWMVSSVPVLPPTFRPVSMMQGKRGQLIADPNYLYKEVWSANQNLKDLSGQIDDVSEERLNLYNAFKAVTGLGDPIQPKNAERGVKGILRHIFGTSPKLGTVQFKLLGASVNLVGRGVIIPNPDMDMDSIGIPEHRAWEVYQPFIVRGLVRKGVPKLVALQAVKDRNKQAKDVLLEAMNERPVLVNRYPVLHRYGLMAFWPKMVHGETIHVSPIVTKAFGADFDGDLCLGSCYAAIDKNFVADILKTCNLSGTITSGTLSISESYLKEREMPFSAKLGIPTLDANENLYMFNLEDFPHAEYVRTTEGQYGKIDWYNVPKGIRVLAFDEKTGRSKWTEATIWSKHHKCPVELVNLRSGLQIVTDNDPRAVYGVRAGSLEFCRNTPRDAVKEKMLVPRVVKREGVEDPAASMQYLDIQNHITGREKFGLTAPTIKLDADFGYFIGAMAGDGWSDCGTQICLSSITDAITNTIDVFVTSKFDQGRAPRRTTVVNKSSYGKSIKHSWGSTILAKLVDDLVGHLAENKHLPPWFMKAPKEFKEGLFAGLMDTGGSISISNAKKNPQLMSNISSTSIRLLQEITLLAASLGIRSRITTTNTPAGNPCWVWTPSNYDLSQWGGKYMQHPDKLAVLRSIKVEKTPALVRHDLVPMSRSLAAAICKAMPTAGDRKAWPAGMGTVYPAVSKAKSEGFITRATAERINAYLPNGEVDHPDWYKWQTIVANTNVTWDPVDSYETTNIKETGYDLTVPGYETFTSVDGVVLSNTMQYHVAVDDAAKKDAIEKMLPSANLFSGASFKVHYLPNQEYVQGLHAASTAKDGEHPKRTFATRKDAIAAYKRGEINLGTPIDVLEK